ncbi:MAG: iron-sulfur cluster assembly scaffold protein [Halobacteriota archaeon]|nr:iron-sulfur cluster assembly scaffold protein [Halobacteriota archaeon]
MSNESDLDRLVNEIQNRILKEDEEDFSKITLDHAYNPRNVGKIEDAEGVGRFTGPCGDTMHIYLQIVDNRIAEARFLTDGCGSTAACGSVITELVKEKSVDDALLIESDELLTLLDGLPESNKHCSVLAVNTLRTAINSYFCRR